MKLKETMEVVQEVSYTALTVGKAIFYLAGATTLVYASLHLHHLLTVTALLEKYAGIFGG